VAKLPANPSRELAAAVAKLLERSEEVITSFVHNGSPPVGAMAKTKVDLCVDVRRCCLASR